MFTLTNFILTPVNYENYIIPAIFFHPSFSRDFSDIGCYRIIYCLRSFNHSEYL